MKIAHIAGTVAGLTAWIAQPTSYGQPRKFDLVVPPGRPKFVQAAPIDLDKLAVPSYLQTSGITLSMPKGSNRSSDIFKQRNPNAPIRHPAILSRPFASESDTGNIPGVITVPTFTGAFAAQAGPDAGKIFPYVMAGGHPLVGGTTTLPVNIIEVSLELLDADGSTLATIPFAPFEDAVLNSPNFADAHYSSSPNPTQYGDAVQRAEFFPILNRAAPGTPPWHTLLAPRVVDRVTIQIPRFVKIQLGDGSIIQARSYFYGQAPDGNMDVIVLDLLFNYLFDGFALEKTEDGTFQSNAINAVFSPNMFLFSLNMSDPNTAGDCCVVGEHTYGALSGVPQPRYLVVWASWISPGLLPDGFQDVTGISHEIAETLNDPFVDTVTPEWQFPNPTFDGHGCQANLETADPVEVLHNDVFPVTLPVAGKPFTFHPHIQALLQWFEMATTSDAIDGAFSYPDTTTLPQAAAPCPTSSTGNSTQSRDQRERSARLN